MRAIRIGSHVKRWIFGSEESGYDRGFDYYILRVKEYDGYENKEEIGEISFRVGIKSGNRTYKISLDKSSSDKLNVNNMLYLKTLQSTNS